jgi:transcriptional regulator with XRE-family HTH domain
MDDALMNFILNQLKKRRLELGLKQKDMLLRIGLSRQQYQHLESQGNPRLDTLELLNSELMLIPKEKISVVKKELEKTKNDQTISQDPWKDLLGEENNEE